jgi:hypothetical protein
VFIFPIPVRFRKNQIGPGSDFQNWNQNQYVLEEPDHKGGFLVSIYVWNPIQDSSSNLFLELGTRVSSKKIKNHPTWY